MELLRGTAPTVKFYGPTPDTNNVVADVTVNGVDSVVGAPSYDVEENSWELQLPYLSSDVNDVEVTWNFTIDSVPEQSFDETISYEAVTPYLTKQEIKAIYPEATDQEVVDLEAGVRHIINGHTGQKFGFDKDKTLTVEGHGERALRLPERLVNLTGFATLTAELDIRGVIVVSDGWYLKKGWAGVLAPIENDSTYWSGWTVTSDAAPGEPGYEQETHGTVIAPPGVHSAPTVWRDDYPFEITGDWGYESVPSPVKEAAKLLVNDYACSEVAYRDRYLQNIQAADWRLQFNANAWVSTGNVRADQLLADYHILDWAVV